MASFSTERYKLCVVPKLPICVTVESSSREVPTDAKELLERDTSPAFPGAGRATPRVQFALRQWVSRTAGVLQTSWDNDPIPSSNRLENHSGFRLIGER
ncbi:hypothetical protein PCANC_20933 [Puccinia coronata f. sp. avenae]|uniref:Uncharacterized protein n=1 Tax=Puccinia coronata f. sp. avenae TaxID=200324 RepID=A0A2N5SID2_9BASI|nr:hypothetical protein PCANC_20933 [Puccinia coronata f. sp. avenae]